MNNPFDRTIIHELEKPLADDINQAETNFDQALRFFLAALFANPDTGTPLDGFLGTGLLVAAASPSDMSVSVTAGLGFQSQISTEIAIAAVPGLNDLDTYKPIPLAANQAFTVPVAPVGPNTRIDIIEVLASRITTDPSLRQVFNIGLGQFVPGMLDKTLAWALDGRAAQVSAPTLSTAPLSYVIGQAGNPGVAPPTTPGYIKLAEIAVGSGVLAIASADITDFRQSLTERVSKINYPAAAGWVGAGTGAQTEEGSVLVSAGGVWFGIVGQGLEAGDIIENIVVVGEKETAGASFFDVQAWYNDVDLNTLVSASPTLLASGSTPAISLQKLYVIDLATTTPAAFPFVWQAGYTMTMRFESGAIAERFKSTYFVVRRATIKRDS